jgi:glycosyltransferase involved in cell wall biosynthesis
MNIIFINHIYLGSELSSTTHLSMIKSLRRLGIDASLYVPSAKKMVELPNVHTLPTPSQSSMISGPVLNMKLLYVLPALLVRKKPDVVLVDCLTFPGSLPCIVLSSAGLIKTQFVFDVRSHPVSSVGIIGKFRDIEYIASLRFSKLIMRHYTFLTRIMANEQCARAGIDEGEKHIGYWGCGVDVERFNPVLYVHDANRLRVKLDLAGKFIVFYHGVLAANRGLDNAIRAFALIAPRYRDMVLFLLGDGPERQHLLGLTSEYHLEDRVVFCEPVRHELVPGYIGMADLCVIPLPDHSDWRGQQPLKLAEYLAMGKPILATNIPAHADILRGNPAGILLPNNDPETLARGLEDAHRKGRSLAESGRQGRALATQALTWDKIAGDLAEYLDRVVERK